MRKGALKVGLVAVSAVVLLGAQHAWAATTIGSSLTTSPSGAYGGGVLIANASLPAANTAAGGLFAPGAGVIVGFAIRTGGASDPGTVQLVVLAGNTRVASGPDVPAPTKAGIAQYSARVPIPVGGRVALQIDSLNVFALAQPPGGVIDGWLPSLADGETRSPTASSTNEELLLQATIEPDGDADGFGDETQDGCVGTPGPRGGCPDPPTAPDTQIDSGPSGKLKRPKATFTFSSPSPGATFECALDQGGFSDCSSPKKLKKLANGKHRFRVRAVSAAGLLDRTPAEGEFKVKVTHK